jgi:hypothetical protein
MIRVTKAFLYRKEQFVIADRRRADATTLKSDRMPA